LGDALYQSSESVRWLADDEELKPRGRKSLDIQTAISLNRFSTDKAGFAHSIRALRRRELERVGMGWMNRVTSSGQALRAMTDIYDCLLQTALRWSINDVNRRESLDFAPVEIVFIALGRYGGREVNFSSDADVMCFYQSVPDSAQSQMPVDDKADSEYAKAVLDDVREILSGSIAGEQRVDLDFDLRPEGRSGPMVRTYESMREYYMRWSDSWESQALLRARVAAGDQGLGRKFLEEVIDPLRYPVAGVSDNQLAQIRQLKARMEAERLPRGVRRERHLKLGEGGLSDIEWTVQLMQLKHAADIPALRTTSTMEALDVLEKSGVVVKHDAAILRKAWRLASDARNANFIWQGRVQYADILPEDSSSLSGIAACMGRQAHQGTEFENEILQVFRQCRQVVMRLFY
jgi:glutamate-ammonia-ligase adenylyltransferase